jgi:hypothetical protein
LSVLAPPPVELSTPRLRLRAPRRGDADALHDAISETLPALVRRLPWARIDHGRARPAATCAPPARPGRAAASEFTIELRAGSGSPGVTSLHRASTLGARLRGPRLLGTPFGVETRGSRAKPRPRRSRTRSAACVCTGSKRWSRSRTRPASG